MKYVICLGDVTEGFEFVGPFDGSGAAHDYMQNDRRAYVVVLLQEPASEAVEPASEPQHVVVIACEPAGSFNYVMRGDVVVASFGAVQYPDGSTGYERAQQRCKELNAKEQS